MKVLITGVCGFVGSVLARGLRAHREEVTVCGIDNLCRKGSETNVEPLVAEGIDVRVGDVRNSTDLNQFEGVDWLIDAAANPSVLAGVDGASSSRELLDHNLVGTIQMLEFCRDRGIPFTLLSTSRVYSIPVLRAIPLIVKDKSFQPDCASRNSSPRGLNPGYSSDGINATFSTEPPLSLYGASKRCSEVLALEYGSAFGFPVWINRCGVLAGAGQFGKPDQGIFAYWIHSWAQRRALKYLGFGGTGYQVRDCLHPSDLVPLLLRQFGDGCRNNKPRVINVSGGASSAISLFRLSDWCAERFGSHQVTADPSERLFDLPWAVLDSLEASETWGWRPAISQLQIFEGIASHAERNPRWLELSA